MQGREDGVHPGRVQHHGVELPGEDEHTAGQRGGVCVCCGGMEDS